MAMQFTKDECDQIAQIANRVNRLSTRVDAFFERRAQRRVEKAQRRDAKRAAKRDSSDPITADPGTPVDWREDNDLEQRPELRTGALSKEQE
jgi:hypothetical protein